MARMRGLRNAAAGALAMIALLPFPARADWVQASSPHFVIYADASAQAVQRFSHKLELFHAALSLVTQRNLSPPSPSNRVTIYVVGGQGNVRKLHGGNSRYVGAFFVPRAGGSVAFVPSLPDRQSTDTDFSQVAFLHEYAHHFMYMASPMALPRWISEGSAEFFASASFSEKGQVWIGRPAHHRAAELYYSKDVTATHLIDPDTYTPPSGRGYDAYYGKAWLLYHYLTFEPSRDGQLMRYMLLMASGTESSVAGREVFGDLEKLEDELEKYMQRPRIAALQIPENALKPKPTTVERVSSGLARMMPVIIRSRRGVSPDEAKALVIEARALAEPFPTDPDVQAALAEAEHDAGNDAAAIAAADAALAQNPKQVNALVQKSMAQLRQARDKGDPALFQQARKTMLSLNNLENDHPLPLMHYYLSFSLDGRNPSANAVDALERASELAPFDMPLRMLVARQQLSERRSAAAIANLRPVAFNPHGGALAELARQWLTRLDTDPQWSGADLPSDLAEQRDDP